MAGGGDGPESYETKNPVNLPFREKFDQSFLHPVIKHPPGADISRLGIQPQPPT